jgi:hypothetical protein
VSYRVTVRRGPKVDHERAGSLDEAIEIAKRHVRGSRRRDAVEAIGRRYEAADQVAVRIELKGPGGRGGVDVRGDGAVIAWTGRVFRTLLDGDDPYEALAHRLSVDP